MITRIIVIMIITIIVIIASLLSFRRADPRGVAVPGEPAVGSSRHAEVRRGACL